MGTSRIILPFFLFCFICFPHFILSVENCLNNRCSKDEPVVSYPFRIIGRQGKRCGHPGFDLTCDIMDRTVLDLPFSGRFFVREIITFGRTYKKIRLFDPDDCLPRRVLNQLNLSGTPFIGSNYQNYSFFSCQLDTSLYDHSWTDISCLSNSTHKVFSATSLSSHNLWDNTNCTLIANVPVPVDNVKDVHDDYPWFPFENVLHLTWNWKAPYCKRNCKKKSNYPSFGGPDVHSGSKAFPIVVGIIIPTVIATALCYVILKNKRSFYAGGNEVINSSQLINITISVDGSVLQSFPTIVLGESGRLPNYPDNNTCAICLSEYQPKETLKTLPACNHCFHADCIDVWLHLNSTCPVCRVSPFQ